LFIENEKQRLSGDIIELFVAWILRDGRHPIHLTSSVVAGCSAGSIGGLCEILKESGKDYCVKRIKELLTSKLLKQLAKKVVIFILHKYPNHWISIVLVNPLQIHLVQTISFPGYLIYDPMGPLTLNTELNDHWNY